MTIKENLAYLRYFGFKLTFLKTLNRIAENHRSSKLYKLIRDENHRAIEEYIEKTCTETLKKLSHDKSDERKEEGDTIWTLWWQGEEEAPPLVRYCFESMRKNSNGRKLVVIDQKNYKNYISLPPEIIERYEARDVSPLSKARLGITHLSDIIRLALLYKYGGVWLDSTIFLTAPLNDKYFQNNLTTLTEEDEDYIGRGRYTIYFLAARKNNKYIGYLYEMLIEYWKKRRYYVTYLMIYSMFELLRKRDATLEAYTEKMHIDNLRPITMNRLALTVADENEIEEFLENQSIHKLSYKWWGSNKGSDVVTEDEKTGRLTWFGYLHKKYMEKK